MTMLESAVFEETFLGLLGLLRQKGEVLLLKMSAGACASAGIPMKYILARIYWPYIS